ncbi:PEP-CTERM sorting domain-containing protein [Leptothrix discophora]|uniref:PEPxxWA-CTERM sorting domain-containing protein n=1 Tax=Leptothrix discophora TaxID=89 RepID=A0ABT9G0G2_LEPDI|nr:PEP-CTERM sorting domain-containing protein [Leptothrix discophora]MDP4299910.1 PEPxxWA-CTERM sorting domain-containing protein [Leptothrix discophora]
MSSFKQILTALALGAVALGSQAQIVNGSFEAPSYADESSTALSYGTHGWGSTGVVRIVNPEGSLSDGAGSQYASLVAPTYAPFSSAIYQSFSLASGNFTLNFLSWGNGTFSVDHWSPTGYAAVSLNPAPAALSSTGWTPNSHTFNSIGGDYRVRFATTSELRVDGVSVSVTAVPEPETYAMMLAGLGAIGFMARRRKASA